jgi:hypothetical protein
MKRVGLIAKYLLIGAAEHGDVRNWIDEQTFGPNVLFAAIEIR